ncbi:hypothetical protein B0I37DRAFT_107964 [Chaetomium sp. MPI-CAGE-AT-0009]|nr:hypothetical protein B0I37DRAFT_107964 [Chaetomium sp. MPI-CAGE-AT-0009]
MAIHGDHDQAPLLTEWSSENSGREDGETDLAEPSTPNRNRARKVGKKRVPDRKVKQPELCLPCPVCVGRPARYAKVTKKCIAGATYEGGLSKLIEHIKRVHSKTSFCVICMKAFPGMPEATHLTTCQPRMLTTEEKDAYPTILDNEVWLRVKKWRKTVTARKDRGGLVVHRWKHIFEIIYPGETIPDPLPNPLGSSPEPPAPHSPAPRGKRRGKRHASSSPHCKPPGLRRRQASPEAQVADEAEAVGSELAAVNLSQPQPNGHSAVPFEGQPHDPNRDLVSPYSMDNIDPRLCTVAAEARMPSIPTMDTKSIAQSETTAVTGLRPDTYAGSTAVSDTNPFLNYANQPPKPSLAIEEDEDNNYGGLSEREFLAFGGEGPAMDPGIYADNLDNEDLLPDMGTLDTPSGNLDNAGDLFEKTDTRNTLSEFDSMFRDFIRYP